MFRLPGLESERNIRGEHSSIYFPFYFLWGEAFLSEMAVFSQALRLCPVLLVSGKERVPRPLSRKRPAGAGMGLEAQKPGRGLLPGAALGTVAGLERHLVGSVRISTWRLLGGIAS